MARRFLKIYLDDMRGVWLFRVMPLVQLELTEDETNRVDRLATAQFRTRRSQVMALLHTALPIAEAELVETENAKQAAKAKTEEVSQ